MSHEVVCLHDRPELTEKCAKLLNGQWPRSLSSRLRSLEQTNNNPGAFPTSLLLIQKNNDDDDDISVIGHSKILPVPYSNDACFVESVVIESSLRKKGLGRIIMEETENFVRKKGVKAVHLTTHDQQGFYSKLGYKLSEPIVVYGGISVNLHKFIETHTNNNNSERHDQKPSSPALPQQENDDQNNTCQVTTSQKSSLMPPPPPPPPPLIVPIHNNLSTEKVYMVKHL